MSAEKSSVGRPTHSMRPYPVIEGCNRAIDSFGDAGHSRSCVVSSWFTVASAQCVVWLRSRRDARVEPPRQVCAHPRLLPKHQVSSGQPASRTLRRNSGRGANPVASTSATHDGSPPGLMRQRRSVARPRGLRCVASTSCLTDDASHARSFYRSCIAGLLDGAMPRRLPVDERQL